MVAVPEPVRLVGVIVPHARPLGTVSLRVTVPAKPFSGATAMMDVALTPAFTVALVGLADIVKS